MTRWLARTLIVLRLRQVLPREDSNPEDMINSFSDAIGVRRKIFNSTANDNDVRFSGAKLRWATKPGGPDGAVSQMA